jgi:hypothetical protein
MKPSGRNELAGVLRCDNLRIPSIPPYPGSPFHPNGEIIMYSRMRPAAAVCAALLAVPLLSACGGAAEAEEQPRTATTAAAQIEPVTMVIQMSGLLLMVPPAGGVGATHVLMPRISGHISYIGFRREDDKDCTKHNDEYDICYIDVNNWTVEPIGPTTTATSKVPGGALNLSRGSGNVKIDTTKAGTRDSIRSRLTFQSGSATDSCGLATWTFDPYGNPPPEKLRLINVLEWQIPDLQSETLQLVLRWRGPDSKPDSVLTLQANDSREIELLVLHVTNEEGAPFVEAERRSAAGPQAPSAGASGGVPGAMASAASPMAFGRRSEAVRAHFNTFYEMMGVAQDRRRMPTRPVKDRELCPITILDLEDYERTSGPRGISTYSCVMASAEGA